MKTFKIAAFAFVLGLTSQISTAQTSTTNNQEQTSSKVVVLKVSGINCGHDLQVLKDKVSALKGVKSCEVEGKRGIKTKYKIDFDPSVISEKEIRNAFESTPGCEDPNALPYKVK